MEAVVFLRGSDDVVLEHLKHFLASLLLVDFMCIAALALQNEIDISPKPLSAPTSKKKDTEGSWVVMPMLAAEGKKGGKRPSLSPNIEL